ncbi:MAG TPA: heavy metal-responsive transcriptional regulator [Pyrinomonadaceae bacterium]|jgi:DNA-binding transcriptional MerR regulator|nr:heavy metal-responsive transcriptional regulator [Pyrinomonadaceae bacterium]
MNSKAELADTRTLLRIGEVAKASGVGIETLRFYERSGLLGRPARTQSGYRLYSADILTRLDFIKRAQVLGFSLQEINQIIADKQTGRSPCREVREIVRQRLDELDEKMKEMRRYRRELGAALARWDETDELDGHVCGLIEGTEVVHTNPMQHQLTGSAKRKNARK